MPDRLAASAVPGAIVLDRRTDSRPPFTPEQRRAIDARHPVVALSAGAGSGKTTVLVQRFIELVCADGVSPLAILAITFTDRAAAEMKERIVRRFEERGDEANRRRAEAAYVSTIHGFCARLLRENPLAAGVDPTFGIVGDLERGIFLDGMLQRMQGEEWFVEAQPRFANGYGASRPRLFELVHDVAFRPADFGRGEPAEAGYDAEAHVEAARARVEAWVASEYVRLANVLLEGEQLWRGLTIKGPGSSANYVRFVGLLDEVAGGRVADAAWTDELLATTGFTRGIPAGPEADATRALVSTTRKAMGEIAKIDPVAQAELERHLVAPLKVRIHTAARELRAAYETFKRERLLLDFEDLQRRALALLRRPEVRAQYADRFAHVLLDESQDVNDVQMALLDAVRPAGQPLFAVGDVKQAIYGFRGANVSIFRDLHRDAGAGRLALRDNYRSRGAVIDFVNEAGARLWARDASLDYEPLAPRLPYPDAPEALAHVQLHLVGQPLATADDAAGAEPAAPLAKEDADTLRMREATWIAAWIRDAVEGTANRAPLTVWDADAKRQRPLRYGDVAVLGMSRTPFPCYERALADVGVPFVKDGGRGFFAGHEVQDVVAALAVVHNPLDDVALLTALRSPLFGWADDDLVRLRLAAGDRRPLWTVMARGFEPLAPRGAHRAHDVIADLRRHASVLPPAALVARLLDATAYEAALLRHPRGRAQVANLRKLADFASEVAALEGPSLAGFLHRARLAQRYLDAEPEAAAAVSGEEAVVLSTIHGAKGLEWPVVVLCALDADFARADSGSRYSADDEALVLAPKGDDGEAVKTAAYRALTAAGRQRDEAEARRLFYVATTRAREYLLLTGRAEYTKTAPTREFAKPLQWLLRQADIGPDDHADRVARLGDVSFDLVVVTEARTAPLLAAASAASGSALGAARQAVRDGRAAGFPASPTVAPALPAVRAAVERVTGVVASTEPQTTLVATTVTQLVYFFRCPMVYYHDLVLQVEEHPRARRRARGGGGAPARLGALALGTHVHDLLERADLAAEPLAEAARLASSLDGVGESDRARVAALAANALRDPLLDRARRARMLEREYPFFLDVAGTPVQGVIDLVFEDEAGRGVVVDYKSNDLAAPDRLEVLDRYYTPQIELYALAASRARIVEPAEATLYFLNRSVARTHAVDARRLAVVEEQAASAIGRIARRDYDTEPGEKCRGCGYRARGFCEVGKRWSE